MVAIFPNLCLWRRSLCSNVGGIHPEKLYRATLRSLKRVGKSYCPANPKRLALRLQNDIPEVPEIDCPSI